MAGVNYKINNVLFPFEFGAQHLRAFSQEVEWNGRAVCHVILGILEILPTGINYIIAIFDAIFNHHTPQVLPLLPEPKASYLANFKPYVIDALRTSSPLIPVLCNIVADYLLEGTAIGPEELAKIYGVKTDRLELEPEFYVWWHRPDAHDLMLNQTNPHHQIRLNCETHYPPVLCPPVIHTDTNPPEALTLEVMGRLAENPKARYYPSRYVSMTESLIQNKQAQVGPASYISMRREVLGRGLSLREQIQFMRRLNADFGAGYEEKIAAPDVTFVVFTMHAFTGVRPLGDSTGAEGRYTLSRCAKNTVQYGNDTCTVAVGYFSPLIVGGPGPSGGLDVDDNGRIGHDYIGVAGLRKFLGHRKLDT